jgi:hypothetical protein
LDGVVDCGVGTAAGVPQIGAAAVFVDQEIVELIALGVLEGERNDLTFGQGVGMNRNRRPIDGIGKITGARGQRATDNGEE